MAIRRSCFLACAGIVGLLAGCVERRLLIKTDPPGAMVYVNDKRIGPSPATVPFIYYGTYRIKLEADGYQTQVINEKVSAPVYEYPPLDFVVENLNPFKISDNQEFLYRLVPMTRPNLDELRIRAEELRERGRELPPPTISTNSNNRPGAPPRPNGPPIEALPPPTPTLPRPDPTP
jgi:hypothetical protein